jgi:hypothetical protein
MLSPNERMATERGRWKLPAPGLIETPDEEGERLCLTYRFRSAQSRALRSELPQILTDPNGTP